MPTDYGQIRAENIARYGWDTAVLELLGQLYSERTHFIFELIQNAEDAGATTLTFELSADRLELRHDGRPFTTADVRGICGVSQGTKADDLTQIGRFGIGFKSVYAYTNAPRISSGDEHFTIESYVRPHPARPLPAVAGQTVFSFPFDRPEVPAPVAQAEIATALAALNAEVLLFLRHIDRIGMLGTGLSDGHLQRTTTSAGGGRRELRLTTSRAQVRTDASWLVWSRPLAELGEADLSVELAVEVRSELDVRLLTWRDRAPLVVTFPTEKETELGFLISGPYRTTPARDNVPEHDAWNQALAAQTARLLVEVLTELRADRLLTAAVLLMLPLDEAHFTAGSLLRPLFDAVRYAFFQNELIPDSAGGYQLADRVRLAGDVGLPELLTPEQLGELLGLSWPAAFAHESITAAGTPSLWRYLRDELGVPVVTPESVVTKLTAEFLAEQSDAWIGLCYQFIDQYPSLWRDESGIARSRPIIRLEDGRQVLPFSANGRRPIYLGRAQGSWLPSGGPWPACPVPVGSYPRWASLSLMCCRKFLTRYCRDMRSWRRRPWIRWRTKPTLSWWHGR